MHYRILQGTHSADGTHIGFHFGRKSMERTIKFHSTCKYEIEDADQFDINKVYGFSEGYHHHNSARFGWRYNKYSNDIELLAYVYNDGKRIQEWQKDILIKRVKLDQEVKTKIEIFRNKYVFSATNSLGTSICEMPRGRWTLPFGYKLFPYFGGDKTAPHDMYIEVSK